MTSEMIDRVARAINKVLTGSEENVNDFRRRLAIAAIEAMRGAYDHIDMQPIEDRFDKDFYRMSIYHCIITAYDDILDAALKGNNNE